MNEQDLVMDWMGDKGVGEEVVSETTPAPRQISVPFTDGVHHDRAGLRHWLTGETFLTHLVKG